jgi:hypothetical protein
MKRDSQSDHVKDIYTNNNIQVSVLFVFITAIYLVLAYISDQFILGDEVYIRSFSDQTIETILNIRERYGWLNYVFMPLTLFLKIFFPALCISIGAVLSSLEFKFKTFFKAVLLAEAVFILAQIVYLINLSQHLDALTIETSLNYFPLSVLSIYGVENVVPWLHYPLQTLNLFEVFYILIISWLLSKQWKPNFIESLNIVLPSYGTGLLLWLVLVTFLTLQIS